MIITHSNDDNKNNETNDNNDNISWMSHKKVIYSYFL